MSTLVETVNAEIKSAMLERNKVKLEALRSLKKEFLEAMTAKGSDGSLSEERAMQIVAKLIKQREESAQIYKEQQREDLAQVECEQADALRVYLPKQLSKEEMTAEITKIIAQTGVTDIKGMGRVMGMATKALAGRADGKDIADIVRQLLS